MLLPICRSRPLPEPTMTNQNRAFGSLSDSRLE